jgi:hypothetical protein
VTNVKNISFTVLQMFEHFKICGDTPEKISWDIPLVEKHCLVNTRGKKSRDFYFLGKHAFLRKHTLKKHSFFKQTIAVKQSRKSCVFTKIACFFPRVDRALLYFPVEWSKAKQNKIRFQS